MSEKAFQVGDRVRVNFRRYADFMSGSIPTTRRRVLERLSTEVTHVVVAVELVEGTENIKLDSYGEVLFETKLFDSVA